MTASGTHHEIEPGVDAWTFGYVGERRRQRGFADGLEIFLQLEGELGLTTPARAAPRRRFAPGQIMVLDSGEAYEQAADGPGAQFGFTIRPDALAARFGGSDDVHLPGGVDLGDPRLVALARHLAASPVVDADTTRQARDVLLEFIQRHAARRPHDPVAQAKAMIERDPQQELYVHHLGEQVGLHAATLRRQFRRRYGVSPVAFRLRMRLNRAAWLLWSCPARPIAELGAEAGFADESFFYRTFRTVVGITPAQYRVRHTPTA